MALSIKDVETDRLVRRYASLRGTSYTDAVRHAVGEALTREEELHLPVLDEAARKKRSDEFLRTVRRVQAEVAKLPVFDDRDHAEMLYDEDGLPK